MDYTLPKLNNYVKIHNDLIDAQNHFTGVQLDILNLFYSQFRDSDPIDKIYTIKVSELESRTGKELNYNQVYDAVKKLIGHVYSLRINDNSFIDISLLTAARCVKNSGIIELELDKNIRPYLFNLKENYTTFEVDMILRLRSKFAKRMYQLLMKYKHTGFMILPVYNLKVLLGMVDSETGEEKYKNFNDFEKNVILAAQKELVDPIDISFTYTKKKAGRQFKKLDFRITYNGESKSKSKSNEGRLENTVDILSGKNSEVESDKIEIIKKNLAVTYDLSPQQIQTVIQKVPLMDITRTLHSIKPKILDGKIGNIGGFTAKTFDNKFGLGFFKKG